MASALHLGNTGLCDKESSCAFKPETITSLPDFFFVDQLFQTTYKTEQSILDWVMKRTQSGIIIIAFGYLTLQLRQSDLVSKVNVTLQRIFLVIRYNSEKKLI